MTKSFDKKYDDYFYGALHTGLYGAEAWQIIQNILNAIHYSTKRSSSIAKCTTYYMAAYIATNNEVIINVSNPRSELCCTIFKNSSNPDVILQELAKLIKQYMYSMLNREYIVNPAITGRTKYIQNNWNATNTTKVTKLSGIIAKYRYTQVMSDLLDCNINMSGHPEPAEQFDVSFADVFYVYTVFRKYNNDKRLAKFDKNIINRFSKQKLNPLQAEMELCRRQQIKEICDEYERKIYDELAQHSDSTAYRKYQKLVGMFYAKQQRIIEGLEQERDNKLKELNENFNYLK